MPLANYTTEVAAEKSIANIVSMLTMGGAEAVMLENTLGIVSAIQFRITRHGQQIGFRLPGEVDKCLAVLKGQKKVPRSWCGTGHARRVVWRCIHDWVRAQLALIEIGSARVEEVFLPYALTNTGETVGQRMMDQGFGRLLLNAPES